MNKTAYLLVQIDTSTSPPKVAWADVFSEPNPTLDYRFRPFEVLSTDGKDFSDALAKMAEYLGGKNATLDWVLPTLSERAVRALFGDRLPRPPKRLVQLSQVPQNQWVGLRVYHPMTQHEGGPIWRPIDDKVSFDPEHEDPEGYEYDLGTVTDFDPAWIPAKGWEPRAEVWFRMGGGTLHYSADNLWTYRGG